MTSRHIYLPGLLIFSLVCLSGCHNFLDHANLFGTDQISAAKARLRDTSLTLPPVPGSTMLDSVENLRGGQMTECASYHLSQLIGTNELTFPQVLDFYTSSLASSGWRLTLSLNYGRTFTADKGVGLEISDNYRFVPINPTAIRSGEDRFKSMFLVDLGTPVLFPVPNQCQQD